MTEYITLPDSTSSMSKSLYQTEGKMDGLEYKMALAMTNMDNIRWWHRNPERNKFSFCLNGFRNHYPDFIVRTTSGKIILIETKGDQLEMQSPEKKFVWVVHGRMPLASRHTAIIWCSRTKTCRWRVHIALMSF